MCFRASDLRPHGWTPPRTLHIPAWWGCMTEYLPVPGGQGRWQLVAIWDPGQTPNPCGATSRLGLAEWRSDRSASDREAARPRSSRRGRAA
jgi:hypothetical protein